MRRTKRQAAYAMLGIVMFLTATIAAIPGCGKSEEKETLLSEADLTENDKERDKENSVEEEQRQISDASVYVYICGHVVNPGVYELPEGSRVFEAIEAAGGVSDSGVPEAVNQAEKLVDGQQIYVPSKEESEAGGAASVSAYTESTAADGKVNINRAGKEELMTLSGIGEVRAQAIIDYRDTQGPFASPEDIMGVEGIKEATYHKIKDQIKV